MSFLLFWKSNSIKASLLTGLSIVAMMADTWDLAHLIAKLLEVQRRRRTQRKRRQRRRRRQRSKSESSMLVQ